MNLLLFRFKASANACSLRWCWPLRIRGTRDFSWCTKEQLQDSRRLSVRFITIRIFSKFSSNQNANHSRSLFDRLRNHQTLHPSISNTLDFCCYSDYSRRYFLHFR